MQFSDTTNKLGIIQSCERYMRLGDAGISGNAQLLLEFTAHINQVNRETWALIFDAYGGWQYDDSNQTDLPAAVDTITADQVSYALPTGALTIRGIEVKDEGGVWHQLKPITEEQIRDSQAMGEFYKTSGQPLFYQVVGDTVRVFPASDYTQASSFKVFFDRGSVAFASTDTTKAPGFYSEFHSVIPIGASLERLKIEEPDNSQVQWLDARYKEYQRDIVKFYGKRLSQLFPPRVTVRDAVREYK